jgi:hypothetical protein
VFGALPESKPSTTPTSPFIAALCRGVLNLLSTWSMLKEVAFPAEEEENAGTVIFQKGNKRTFTHFIFYQEVTKDHQLIRKILSITCDSFQ